jgi:hypothetical protein
MFKKDETWNFFLFQNAKTIILLFTAIFHSKIGFLKINFLQKKFPASLLRIEKVWLNIRLYLDNNLMKPIRLKGMEKATQWQV